MKKAAKRPLMAKTGDRSGNILRNGAARKMHHNGAFDVTFCTIAGRPAFLPAGGASGAERLLSGAGRQLFAGQLQLIHLPVAAFRRQQLLMGAPLDSLTSMQNGMVSASTMVDSRWAITTRVVCWRTFASACWIACSVPESMFAVASSKISTCGVSTSTRASASSCFCPTEIIALLAQLGVQPIAHAARHRRQLHRLQRFPNLRLTDVPAQRDVGVKVSASTTGSCCTIAMPRRNALWLRMRAVDHRCGSRRGLTGNSPSSDWRGYFSAAGMSDQRHEAAGGNIQRDIRRTRRSPVSKERWSISTRPLLSGASSAPTRGAGDPSARKRARRRPPPAAASTAGWSAR